MADNKAKYGFRFYQSMNGSGRPAMVECVVATDYGTTVSATDVGLSIGDPVEKVSDGTVQLAGDRGDDPAKFFGVIMAISNAKVDANGKARPASYLPHQTTYASLANQSRVMVAPFGRDYWEIDVDDNVTAVSRDDYQDLVDENSPLVYVLDTSNPDRPRAGPRLDISNNIEATDHFRIIGISKTQENVDFSGANVKLIVQLNEGSEPVFNTAGI
jgi:hypothetical protein